jgi:hypothetical protein
VIGVQLVGRFGVSRDGVAVDRVDLGSRKGRQLLKLLAVERDHVVPADRIAAVLWPASSTRCARRFPGFRGEVDSEMALRIDVANGREADDRPGRPRSGTALRRQGVARG